MLIKSEVIYLDWLVVIIWWKFNGISYIKNYLLNHLTNRKIPYSAQIEITLRCNANCGFCSIPTIPEHLKQNEMTTQKVKRIIDNLSKLGIIALSFTGGEPTLRQDLPELINYAASKHKFMTGVATNGFLLPKLLENNLLNNLDYILLSLDYPDAERHNYIRQLDVYSRVIRSIKLAHKRNINVILSTNVMKDNLHLLPEICEFARKANCSIEIHPCENIIRYYHKQKFMAKNAENLIPPLSLWAEIVKFLRKKYKNILTDRISVDVIKNGGFGGNPKHQDLLRCHVAEAYLFVRHDGLITFPCKIHPILLIDSSNLSLQEIYNSKQVREIMNKHDDFDFCDNCYLGCGIVSSMLSKWKTTYEKYIKGFFRGNLR